jgi:serine/threonine protein kinase
VTIQAGTLVPRDARDFGAYQLIAKLATGGMAEIFLARPQGQGDAKDVLVLKRILPHLAEDDHFVTMFRDEAELASKLLHKNVCRVDAYGEFAGTWFIAMEYLHGVPLSRMMTRLSKAGKMLDFRVVAGIICQACEGLHAAHDAKGPDGAPLQIVHRDVSPPNIMVCADGTVKLLDFGIAKARGVSSRTRTGTVKGKNAYMSPEQILGKELDRRSDLFALAVVMYEMLAIKRLFHRESDFLTFKAITEETIPDIRERRPDLPPGMRAALVQAMARDPNGRFDTAQSFGNAIRNSVATLGGPASPQDLARLLFTDFSDEMSARDEILKAADDPSASTSGLKIPEQTTPPPIPTRKTPTKPPPLPGITGEMAERRRGDSGLLVPVPSMIVHQGSSKMVMPQVVDQGVIDLTATVQPDTWMVDPDTDLLHGHRMKSVRNAVIALGILAVTAAVIVLVIRLQSGDDDRPHHVKLPTTTADAQTVAHPEPATFDELATTLKKGDPWATATQTAEKRLGPVMAKRRRTDGPPEDAEWWWAANEGGRCYLFTLVKEDGEATLKEVKRSDGVTPTYFADCEKISNGTPPADSMSKDDIVALSKYGFFSIAATAKTTIYIDNQKVGETPLTRLPLRPGQYTVKAVGPKGKSKTLKISVYGGRDSDGGTITW